MRVLPITMAIVTLGGACVVYRVWCRVFCAPVSRDTAETSHGMPSS